MTNIDVLLTKYDWVLLSWDDRYGRGIWSMVAPNLNQAYDVREIMDGSDIESSVLGDYFNEEGAWMPVTHNETLSDALVFLDKKIQDVNESFEWRMLVSDAFGCVIEENDGDYGLKVAIDNHMEELFERK